MMLIQHSGNCDWLFKTQSSVLQADWFILVINEKATLNINMPLLFQEHVCIAVIRSWYSIWKNQFQFINLHRNRNQSSSTCTGTGTCEWSQNMTKYMYTGKTHYKCTQWSAVRNGSILK